jgi:hypothetical protein
VDRHSKEFKQLQAKWYGKLKKAKFDDIEENEDTLKEWASNTFRNKFDATKYQARLNYYRLAGHFLHEYEFDSDKERAIWELHAEGLSRPKVLKQLKSRNFKTYSRQVQEIIEKLEKEMITKWR